MIRDKFLMGPVFLLRINVLCFCWFQLPNFQAMVVKDVIEFLVVCYVWAGREVSIFFNCKFLVVFFSLIIEWGGCGSCGTLRL